MLQQATDKWSITNAEDTFEVSRWGQGYFSIAENGHLNVHPTAQADRSADLMELVERVLGRGVQLPVLIRFNDILEHRLELINDAFQRAIRENNYNGNYACVYPIKVNQTRQVVEQILATGKRFGFGLEAGSKPELMAVIAIADNETPIICNGFKDSDFIEMAMLALKMGRNVLPVVEKLSELELIIQHSNNIGVRPQFGMRVKLAARGSGRWQSSGGYKSKFGLTVNEILESVKRLEKLGMADCFKLLHFHLGSQITNIRQVKGALVEATRIYAELAARGAGMCYLDVGGGLGVDYDGSQTNFESSMNYSLQEYANDVIHHVRSVCDELNVKHPTVISESGRAITAYHSALIFEVLGVSGHDLLNGQPSATSAGDAVLQNGSEKQAPSPSTMAVPLRDLKTTLEELTLRNLMESYHDAQQSFDMAINAFASGMLSLDERSQAENYYWRICRKVHDLSKQLEYVPEELEKLDSMLAKTYFCNFSLFQSLPDSWAIKQLFPIMPIHRLDEEPKYDAVLGDITCDSDGKVDRFVNHRDVKRTLRLHAPNDKPYYLGAFLIGAYQEILGDLHNLFGDTHTVHVSYSPESGLVLDKIIKGDSVSDVLKYVQFQPDELLAQMQTSVERSVNQGAMDNFQAGRLLDFFEQGLRGYTYLR
jgi:arginine decarboxylase